MSERDEYQGSGGEGCLAGLLRAMVCWFASLMYSEEVRDSFDGHLGD